MPQIQNIQTSAIFVTSETPRWVSGIWECGDQRFTDSTGAEYNPAPVATPSAALSAYTAVVPQYEAAVQHFMDAAAKTRGYDNLVTVISYADEPSVPRFQQEGQAFRAWRSLVWEKCLAVMGAAAAGGVIPTLPDLIADLPPLTGLPD
jgi:hypothetical protein